MSSLLKQCQAVLLAALLMWPQPSQAQISPGEILTGATNVLGKYTPLSLAVGGLLNLAIEKANSDLADRLRQLDAIVQSAIFNLNQMLKERIQDLDQKVRTQRMEAIRELDRLSVNISNILQKNLDELNKTLAQSIDGFQNALGNTFASLPIPTEPLINVGQHGLTIIANANGNTRLFVTGSGFLKGGKKPEAFVHLGSNDRNGTQLEVETASMGFLSIILPASVIPSSLSPQESVLSLGFNPGGFGKPRWPSFPLTICGAIPRYTIKAKLVALDGAAWERKVIGPQPYYIASDSNCCSLLIKPEMFVSGDWVVDRDRSGFTNGLQVVWNPPTSPGGAGEHSEQWTAAHDGFGLWIGGHGGNNSHAYVNAALKRASVVADCGFVEAALPLEYSEDNEMRLSKTAALGSCDASLKTPNIVAQVLVLKGGSAVTRSPISLPLPSAYVKALNGEMSLSIDTDGLLKIGLTPSCKQTVGYRIVE